MTVAQLAQERADRRRLNGLIVALVILAVITVVWAIPHIENELTATAERTLADRGWSGLTVEFSGRDATVAGSVAADAREVSAAVAAIDGVRSVRLNLSEPPQASDGSDIEPVATLGEPMVTLTVSPDPAERGRQIVALLGTVPSELVVQLAADAAAAVAGGGPVVNKLEVAPTRDALWLTRLDTILQALDGAGDVTVLLGDGRAVVTGTVVTESQLEEIRTAMLASVAPELDLVMGLDVAPASAPELEITTDGDSIQITGQVPEDVSVIVRTLAEQVFGANVTLDLATDGVAEAPWLDVALELIPQLHQGADLQIRVDGSAVVASGAVGSTSLVDAINAALVAIGEMLDVEPQVEVEFDVAAAAALCPPAELNAIVSGGVLFESNSAELTEEGVTALDQVAALLLHCEGVVVEVGGHTDDIGDADYNQLLSEQRAASVVAYLVEQGVDEDRLVAVGYGESEPIADNGTSEGRALNRRIEFTLLGGV